MKALLDTHCWLWWMENPDRLNSEIREWLEDAAHPAYFSAASAWEISIKHGLGKIRLPEPPARYIETRLSRESFQPLPITIAHATRVSELPPHHRDPFDRVIIAQAACEGLTLITADRQLEPYAKLVNVRWAD